MVFHFIFNKSYSILAVCDHGYYGMNCSDTCGHCVNGNTTCDIATGQCPDGCSAGWKGETCNSGKFILNL